MPAARLAELDQLSAASGVRRADLIRYAVWRLFRDADAHLGELQAIGAGLAALSPNVAADD